MDDILYNSALKKIADAKHPWQQKIRDAKKNWSKGVRSVVKDLTSLTRGLNGASDGKAGIPASKITDPLPSEVRDYVADLSDRCSSIIEEAKSLIEQQDEYSEAFKRKKEERLNERKKKVAQIKNASMALSRTFSWITQFPIALLLRKDVIKKRLTLMYALQSPRDSLNDIEKLLTSNKPGDTEDAIRQYIQFLLLFESSALEDYAKFVYEAKNAATNTPKQLPGGEAVDPIAAVERGGSAAAVEGGAAAVEGSGAEPENDPRAQTGEYSNKELIEHVKRMRMIIDPNVTADVAMSVFKKNLSAVIYDAQFPDMEGMPNTSVNREFGAALRLLESRIVECKKWIPNYANKMKPADPNASGAIAQIMKDNNALIRAYNGAVKAANDIGEKGASFKDIYERVSERAIDAAIKITDRITKKAKNDMQRSLRRWWLGWDTDAINRKKVEVAQALNQLSKAIDYTMDVCELSYGSLELFFKGFRQIADIMKYTTEILATLTKVLRFSKRVKDVRFIGKQEEEEMSEVTNRVYDTIISFEKSGDSSQVDKANKNQAASTPTQSAPAPKQQAPKQQVPRQPTPTTGTAAPKPAQTPDLDI